MGESRKPKLTHEEMTKLIRIGLVLLVLSPFLMIFGTAYIQDGTSPWLIVKTIVGAVAMGIFGTR